MMKNNVLESIVKAKVKLRNALDESNEGIPCVYRQNGRDTKGLLIEYTQHNGKDVYTTPTIAVRVKSHTGKEYAKIISDLISVEGIDEL